MRRERKSGVKRREGDHEQWKKQGRGRGYFRTEGPVCLLLPKGRRPCSVTEQDSRQDGSWGDRAGGEEWGAGLAVGAKRDFFFFFSI